MYEANADPAYNLEQLNTLIAQQENFMRGPLVDMRSDGHSTILAFDALAPDKPATNTKVTTSLAPAGSWVLKTAIIMLSGRMVPATAYVPCETRPH